MRRIPGIIVVVLFGILVAQPSIGAAAPHPGDVAETPFLSEQTTGLVLPGARALMVSEQPGALAGSPDLLLPLAESGPYNHEGYRTFDRRPRWLLANVEDEDGEEDGEEEGEEEKDDEDEFSILDEIGDPFKNMHERYVREREARLAEIKKKHDEGQELSESDKWYYNYWQRLKRKKWVDKQVKKKRLPRDKAEEAADRLGGFAEIK